jgi:hypothetical protein
METKQVVSATTNSEKVNLMPKFSKSHYEVIARCVVETALKQQGNVDDLEWRGAMGCYKDFAKNLAVMFAKDNPNFNANKFLIACGFQEKG